MRFYRMSFRRKPESIKTFWTPASAGVTFVLLGWLTVLAHASHITGVDSVALSVGDLRRSIAFYTQVLPFQQISESEVSGPEAEKLYGVFGMRATIARLKLGEEYIELRQFLAPEGRPLPSDSQSNDLWFQHFAIIVSDMDKAYAQLRKHHVRHASSGPQRLPDWNKNAGGIKAFYFKDPDGHPIEILEFPADKGDPKWRKGKGLFLGIDHTAIVIGSTENSLAFYRDRLGFAAKGESTNYGTEQEHLNNVAGARLHITSLRAPSGPGVEFLDYVAPQGGRSYPKDAAPNDLIFTETVLLSSDVASDCGKPSADIRGCLLRDPDGHAIFITEKTHAQK